MTLVVVMDDLVGNLLANPSNGSTCSVSSAAIIAIDAMLSITRGIIWAMIRMSTDRDIVSELSQEAIDGFIFNISKFAVKSSSLLKRVGLVRVPSIFLSQ